MKKILLWILPLTLLLAGCSIELGGSETIDTSTLEWRQQHCLQWIKDKVKSSNYEVIWDEENDSFWELILQWLLQVDNWYYDVECIHDKNGTWFEVSLFDIEEITYDEDGYYDEDDYEIN